MIAGIDEWQVTSEDEIIEDRLRRALGVADLYAPPSSDSRQKVPIVRFPEWVSCAKCDRLDSFWNLAAAREGEYINRCVHCLDSTLVPSRFVMCCAAGHIQDFPYAYWVHQTAAGDCALRDGTLRIRNDPADSSLAGIIVTCDCGATRSLAGALGSATTKVGCSGRSPWLRAPHALCSEKTFGLQRGSSNVWFPDVRSALTIDRSATPAEELLETVRASIHGVPEEQVGTLLEALATAHGVDPEQLIATHRRQSGEFGEAFEHLRAEEYEALSRDHPEITGGEQFVCSPIEVPREFSVGAKIRSVSKVSRLREVRALRGFNRVNVPIEANAAPRAKLTTGLSNWLPAIEVLGEGIFIELNVAAVDSWAKDAFAIERARRITDGIRRAAGDSDLAAVDPRRILLHSTAHVLLAELALSSGYPASSIRERIYDGPGQAGILLYTATADAAGSLGGLCSHADPKQLAEILVSAIERASWCSADPVCLESTSSGAGAVNLAACHSCMLLPEVSCEFQNRYLDRACLIGSADHPISGFFER